MSEKSPEQRWGINIHWGSKSDPDHTKDWSAGCIEMDLIRQKIMAGLGVSEEMLNGPTTYSTSSIGYDPTIRQLVRKMADPFFKTPTHDEYVKANLVGEMRKHRGRKRLRKKKAKAALRQRWGFLQLGRMLSRRINYAEISRKMFTVEPLPDPVKPIYMNLDAVTGGEE